MMGTTLYYDYLDFNMYTTTDIAFATFLVQKGLEIHSVTRKGRKVVWSFKITDEELSTLEAKWPSSTSAKFYSIYQTLKTHIKTAK